jgi:hypothetical protein
VARKNGRLTRADLEKIVNAMSAGDVFRAQGAPEEQKAMVIFNSAASWTMATMRLTAYPSPTLPIWVSSSRRH